MSLTFSEDGQEVDIRCDNPACASRVIVPSGSALLSPLPLSWVTVIESVNVLLTGQGKTWLVCSNACAAAVRRK